MTTGDAIFRYPALAIFCAMLAGCQTASQPRPSYTYTPYSPPVTAGSCKNVGVGLYRCKADDVSDCERRAASGDADAMVSLGNLYKTDFPGCTQFNDGQKAVDILRKASDAGNQEALRQLREMYDRGQAVPKNTRLASSALKEGVEKRYEWALAASIYEKDQAGDLTAADDIRTSAINGNCYSQQLLATVYRWGQLSPGFDKQEKYAKNLSKSYFWSLVSVSTAATIKGKKYWDHFGISAQPCPLERRTASWYEVEKQLGPELVAKVQDVATAWKMGSPEPDLQAPKMPEQRKPFPSKIAAPSLPAPEPLLPKPPAKIVPPSLSDLGLPAEPPKATAWSWSPVALPQASAGSGTTLDGAAVFEKVNKSVWRVIAARSLSDLRDGGSVIQGSAVAVTKDTLLTNCHVASGMNVIVVKHGDAFEEAKVVSGSQKRDQCVLKIGKQMLEPVSGVRSYDSLKVGEKVYTVGSPSGLENTLGEGIVSGLRKKDGQRLVQTSAPISPGSSGGGLFDTSGNAIGITTFLLRDAQALNFAIAVEEFGK